MYSLNINLVLHWYYNYQRRPLELHYDPCNQLGCEAKELVLMLLFPHHDVVL